MVLDTVNHLLLLLSVDLENFAFTFIFKPWYMTRRFLGFDPQLMYLMALAASEPSLRYRAGVVNIPRNHNRPPARCTLHARVSAMHVVSAYRCVCVCAQSARAGRQVAGVQLWEVQARVVCLVIFASSAPSSYS